MTYNLATGMKARLITSYVHPCPQREENGEDEEFRPVSSFVCFPVGYVGCKSGKSYTIFRLCSYVKTNCKWYLFRVGFKISRREVEVAVPQDKMFKLKDVIEVILKQVQGEVVLVYEDNVPDKHFSRLMSRSFQFLILCCLEVLVLWLKKKQNKTKTLDFLRPSWSWGWGCG